ncbi:Ribbon-helix-helix protein, copG family [Dehalogenimonas formicexedens]|uniref:Ribbon-helix-helix protein, copG family n=1 Tax=Dehalogenimonas formicexedens TaxID=1839801 RepID=A0A1P8FAC5_9CHLR|nr:ribbon-helix-helix domain-containing protein [Dehalogenimonas formicexedens]APV45403.1 Ribbon-helix-helix protein, copG family [Dehalogenimonas formicexedens]
MEKTKVAVTIDTKTLERLDRMVKNRVFNNRSRAIQQAVEEKLDRLQRSRLAIECAKLDIPAERSMAEEGLAEDAITWPEY